MVRRHGVPLGLPKQHVPLGVTRTMPITATFAMQLVEFGPPEPVLEHMNEPVLEYMNGHIYQLYTDRQNWGYYT